MVTASEFFGRSASLLFAAEDAAEPVLERLDPPRRAAVVMALLGTDAHRLVSGRVYYGGRPLGPAAGAAASTKITATRARLTVRRFAIARILGIGFARGKNG